MDPYARRLYIFGAASGIQNLFRLLYPYTTSSARFPIFLFTSTVTFLLCLHQAAELRATRLAPPALAPLTGHPGAAASGATKEGSAAAMAAVLSPPPPDLLRLEVAFTIVGLGCLPTCLSDAWYLYLHLTATPECFVMQRGVRTDETCEAFYARVGLDNLTSVNNWYWGSGNW